MRATNSQILGPGKAANKMPYPNLGQTIFVKYQKWFGSLEEGKSLYQDFSKLVVKGEIVAINFARKKATVCFPALMQTTARPFSWFSNIRNHLLSTEKELTLKLFMETEGTYMQRLICVREQELELQF